MPYLVRPDYKAGGDRRGSGGPSKKFFSPNRAVGVETGMIKEMKPKHQRREIPQKNLGGYAKWTNQNKVR